MNRLLLLLAVLPALLLSALVARASDCPPLLNHQVKSLQGKPMDLCQYRDNVVLVVNTASYCGHTDQYAPLEALFRRYRSRGLVVLGFPSNDFLQEPGSNQEIAQFCRLTYGVQFPMAEKTKVHGKDASPLYRALAEKTGVAPSWNFHKYLIGRHGSTVESIPTETAPDSPKVVQRIEALLSAS